jgi:hypothetical protein
MESIYAGTAKVDITPPVGTHLAGYKDRKKLSISIHDELYSKALVLFDGKTKVAIITTDLIGVDKKFVSKIRKQVNERTGIKEKNILISASHTHSGPDILKVPEELSFALFEEEQVIEGLSKKDYVDSLREVTARKIAGAVFMADRNLKKAKIGTSKGIVYGVTANRWNLNGPTDNTVGVIKVDEKEKTMAVFINFCGHPTVLGPDNYMISADYPGYAMRLVEHAVGEDAIAMFTNGACGNVSTRFTRREQTFKEAKRLGFILGGEILKVLEGAETESRIKLDVASKTIKLPIKEFPTLKEAEEHFSKVKANFEKLKAEGATREVLRVAYTALEGAERLVKLLEIGGIEKIKEIETEMQAIAIGKIALISIPGELFVEAGLEIKEKSGEKDVFIIGYANDYVGYIPTLEAYKKGEYEVFSTVLSPDASRIVHNTAIELIKKLHQD